MAPDEAVRLGLSRNHLLQAARADAEAAAAEYRQARAERFPSISSQSRFTRLSDNIPEISVPGGLFPGMETDFTLAPVVLNQYYAEIALEQPLFTGLRLHNGMLAARRRARALELEVDQEEADLAYAIREAYWRLYQAMSVRDANEAALAEVEAHLEVVESRREAGAALSSDVLAARTRRSEVQLAAVEAENALQLARLELNRLTGLPLDSGTLPLEEIELRSPPAPWRSLDAGELVDRALTSRPDIESLQWNVRALEAQVASTRGEWLPAVALTGRYVYARPNQYFFSEQDEFHGTWEAGVAVRWNLFDGGARTSATRQAAANVDAARARLDAARDAIALEVMQQRLELQRATDALEVASGTVEQARETLRIVRAQHVEGAALSSQVLEAEKVLRSAQSRHAQERAAYAIARAGMLRALGQIW